MKVPKKFKKVKRDIEAIAKTAMPLDIAPMLATLANKIVDEAGWMYEVKWDGYRALAYLNNGEAELRSRNNKSFNKKIYPLCNVLSRWAINAFFDGEVIVVDKPQTLNRFPNGIMGETFYQKDVKGKAPGWIGRFPYYSDTDAREKEFLVCTDEASLLYTAGLGCLEMKPWHSRKKYPNNPDWCIIDLDPDQNSFNQVIEAVLVTKQVLNTIGVEAFCKTSGSTGLHIYIPFGAKYDYQESIKFGRAIAKWFMANSLNLQVLKEKLRTVMAKMYIDFLQNRPQATVAGPYALRPQPGAPVSTPLRWEEVKKGLKILDFTLLKTMDRLKEQGDIFKGVLGKGINLKKALKALENL